MPSPIAHSLMGCVIARSSSRPYFEKPWQLAIFCAALANLPDSDYFFGIVQDAPNLYHRQFTHSLGFAVLIGLACGLFFKIRGRRFWPMFYLAGLSCFSHVVLDFFGNDTSSPLGVIALWPVSSEYFMSPVTIFSNLVKGDTLVELIKAVFTLHNMMALLREMVVLLLVLATQNWYMKNRVALIAIFKSHARSRESAKDAQSVREF
jgi:inner membrane protein